MAVAVMVDVETLVGDWLRDHAEVSALVDDRVRTQIPPNPIFPHIRLHRIGGVVLRQGWIDRARIQVEAFAETDEVQARLVAATAQAALKEAEEAIHALGVVTFVGEALGLTNAPDPDTGRPRYLFDALVFVHPYP